MQLYAGSTTGTYIVWPSCAVGIPCYFVNVFIVLIAHDISNHFSVSLIQYVCLEACKKLHEMGAITDFLLPDTGSLEDDEKPENAEEGEPIPGTARHREFYPEGIADVLKVNNTMINKSSSTLSSLAKSIEHAHSM